ncbi:arylsulfatase [Lacipirellula sp.]|uniref:arylsulfatase n=1 Tax=Lacipirellula sp. TaxID=2691419 RepID=UPI003D0E27B4
MQFSLAFAFVAAVACSASAASPAASLRGSRPNIILIMPDDMGYADLGCHGNPLIQTPHLDSLASNSFRFTNFQVSPTCAPTRAALMTGRHEFKSGVTHTIEERERLALDAVTVAEALRRAGYATGIFGKWHLGDEEPYQPNRRGFDEVFIHGAGGIGQSYPGSCGDVPNNSYFNPVVRRNGTFERTEGYCTDVFFSEAIKWIGQRKQSGQPFFALITPNAPHEPLVSPGARYDRLYAGKEIDRKPLTTADAAYYAMISNIDDNVGRLIAALAEWKLEENTLVIFMCDNGGTRTHLFSSGERGRKGSAHRGGVHSPAFWHWPGHLPADVKCDALSVHIDLFPTLAELAAVELTEVENNQIEGRSLVPLLENPRTEWPDRILVTHVGRWPRGQAVDSKFKNCSIRNNRFQLVDSRELYDLQEDPGETANVIEKHPEIAAELSVEYDRWWRQVQPRLVNEQAVGPEVNPYRKLYEEQLTQDARLRGE